MKSLLSWSAPAVLPGALLFGLPAFGVACGDPQESPQALAADDGESAGEEKREDAESFARFVDNGPQDARFEVAVARYRDEEGRVVDLVSAVHIGDKVYYEALNRLFRSYDALLYELVADKDVRPTPGSGDDSPISALQRTLTDLLDLEFQLDAIDYQAENFVHADLDPAGFRRLMKEKGESLFTLMLRAMLHEYQRTMSDPEKMAEAQATQATMLLALMSKDRARAMKYALARQLKNIEELAAGFEKGSKGGSVLVVERNKAALRVLQEQLDEGKKRLGIFYGAAHLPDMERRLIDEFGMRRVDTVWLTAWDVSKRP